MSHSRYTPGGQHQYTQQDRELRSMDEADAGTSAQSEVCSIKELVDGGLEQVPARYIRPPQERACPRELTTLSAGSEERVPFISLSSSRTQLLAQVASACSQWGVFQVLNHGVPTTLQRQIWNATYHFFSLPTSAKLELISQDPSCPLLFFTGFFAHEKVREWKDTLGFKPSPSMNHNLLPEFLRWPMLKFHEHMRILAGLLCELIFSSLLEDCKVSTDSLLSRATMGFNYYPSCPEPELTFGLSSHSDFGSITIIMQDEVEGLQVRRKDTWIDVKPTSNSFIVMLGDQLEIMTNGCYKSVEHRVVTNKTKPRMSIGCFYGPNENENVKPLDKCISEGYPTLYKETKFSDYLKNGFNNGLNGKANLKFSSQNLIPSL